MSLREIVRALDRLQVRVLNTIARAVVQRVNDGRKIQILQVGVLAGEDVDDAERFQSYGFSSVPLAGAEAVILFPGGDRGHGLVVAVDDRRYRPTGGEPGEVVVYNSEGATVRLKVDGTIEAGSADGPYGALATKADLDELRDWVALQFGAPGHTHGVSGSSTNSVAAAVAGTPLVSTPTSTGTTKLKAE
jgi:phage gp45-like